MQDSDTKAATSDETKIKVTHPTKYRKYKHYEITEREIINLNTETHKRGKGRKSDMMKDFERRNRFGGEEKGKRKDRREKIGQRERMEDEEIVNESENFVNIGDEKERKKESNRESAKRSRTKKNSYLEYLEKSVIELTKENQEIRDDINKCHNQIKKLHAFISDFVMSKNKFE